MDKMPTEKPKLAESAYTIGDYDDGAAILSDEFNFVILGINTDVFERGIVESLVFTKDHLKSISFQISFNSSS